MNDWREPVRFFDPPGDELQRVQCPFCNEALVLFLTAHEKLFAVDNEGFLHILKCPGLMQFIDFYHLQLHHDGTAYDTALLEANAKFRPPFL
jgi:hypothetical protein